MKFKLVQPAADCCAQCSSSNWRTMWTMSSENKPPKWQAAAVTFRYHVNVSCFQTYLKRHVWTHMKQHAVEKLRASVTSLCKRPDSPVRRDVAEGCCCCAKTPEVRKGTRGRRGRGRGRRRGGRKGTGWGPWPEGWSRTRVAHERETWNLQGNIEDSECNMGVKPFCRRHEAFYTVLVSIDE